MSDSYRRRDDSEYQVVYTHPGSDLVISTGFGGDLPIMSRPEAHRYATAPARTSRTIVEFEDRPKYTRNKSTTTTEIVSEKISLALMSGALTTTAYHTSSRNGTLYFAFGSDISPSHFKWKADLSRSASSRPVALAKLSGWQWMISSRGTPNVVPLCDPGIYNDNGFLRSRERESDATVVYGLIYNLDLSDECKVDEKRGYREHGPRNVDCDSAELAMRPYLQGTVNTVNKLYERVEVAEWLVDSATRDECIFDIKDGNRVKCMFYVDESSKGYRPGRIWDDMIETMSKSVTVAVRNHGLPRRWVESVMGQYEICVLKERDSTTSSSRRRSRSRVKKEVGFVEFDDKDSARSRRTSVREIEVADDDDDVVETRVTKKITESFEPFPRSDFYREKRGSTRYISR